MNEKTNALAEVAARLVMTGAAEYLRVHNLTADAGALAACCRSWAKLKLAEAMAAFKEAHEAHMDQVGEKIFGLTMMEAGIEAAKECGKAIEQAA